MKRQKGISGEPLSSLFYRDYGLSETNADGMPLICDDNRLPDCALNIIRMTMRERRRLIFEERYYERDRLVRYTKSPHPDCMAL